MSDLVTSPQETYERLLGEACDKRRIRSLEALNEVCQLLYERGSFDLSYKTILTLGKDRGLPVPSEKTILNATGAHYRELIQAWRIVSKAGKTSSKQNDTNDWVEHIADPVLRMSVTLLAKELRALKAKDARKSRNFGAPIYLGEPAIQLFSKQPSLNEVELAALKAAINPDVLRLAGLSIGSRGEVFDAKGKIVHKPGFRNAIEKILSVQLKK